MTRRKGKVQWNGKIQKSDPEGQFGSKMKKEDRVWSSYADPLGSPLTLLLQERRMGSPRRPCGLGRSIPLGEGWGTEREHAKERPRDWTEAKRNSKSPECANHCQWRGLSWASAVNQQVIRKTRSYFWPWMSCVMALLRSCDFQTRNQTLFKKQTFPMLVSQQDVHVLETWKVSSEFTFSRSLLLALELPESL